MPTPELTQPQQHPTLWRNLSFMLLWSSVAASGFGDRIVQLAAWTMLGIDQPGAQASSISAGVYFFFFLPYVLLTVPGGYLADVLPRKWIMFTCDEMRAGILLLAFLIVPAGAAVVIPEAHYWKIYAIVFAAGSMAAIFSPAKAAVIPQIVPPRQYQPANAIVLGIAVIASLIGLSVGAALIKVSLKVALVVAVLCFSISGSFFIFMRVHKHARSAIEQDRGHLKRLLQASGYIWRHRPVAQLVLLNVLFWSAAQVVLAAIAALCKNSYGFADDKVIAAASNMMAVLGAGMLCSSLTIAWLNTRRESAWFAMLGLATCGLCMLLLGLVPWYALGLVMAFAAGFFGNTAMICVATLIQSITPNYILGRVSGVRELLSTSSSVIINCIIWRTPSADEKMIPALYVLAGLLASVGLWGLWREITRGPMQSRTLNVMWRFTRAYSMVWHRLTWVGRENVPSHGPVLLAPNHTTGIDPFAIQAAVPRVIRWVMLTQYQFRFANILWNAVKPIALDLDSRDMSRLKQIIRAAEDGEVVGVFPEGRLQREHRMLGPYLPGVGLIAKRSKALIVPVWIEGGPRSKRMLWHFLTPSRTTVIFGKPYRPDPKMNNEEVASDLRRRTLDLARSAGFEPTTQEQHASATT